MDEFQASYPEAMIFLKEVEDPRMFWVAERFDWIVDFAKLWEFIDAPCGPIRRGWVARLGFVVATAWEPEVLLIDEVLAVGDQAFQRKCQARLTKFRAAGTTVLLVSHSPEVIRQMCDRAVWLEQGRLRALGPPYRTTQAYLDGLLNKAG